MKIFTKNNGVKKGSAMIMAVIFFLATAMVMLAAVASPVLREVKIANELARSKQSYYLAESGAEDVAYRLKSGKQTGTSEVLAIDNASVTTTIDDVGGGKTIVAEGNVADAIRKITTSVITGVGVTFNYGVQSGNGGFQMSNNAGITGNLYSNGDIIGSAGSFVTGTAIAANSVSMTADQSNTTPIPPTSSVVFGNANGTQDFAQSFEVSESLPINKISLYLKKTGSPSNITVRIVSDSSGSPAATTMTSGTLSSSLITSSYGWVEVVFTSNPYLNPGNTYWIVLDASTNASNNYTIAANTAYANGVAKTGRYSGTWSALANDGYFNVYVGGVYSKIDNIDIGQDGEGDARAHTVTNSTIAGNLYCQTGSGNNKSCNTSEPDPAPIAYPVSDANIEEWKSDAEAGGVHTGNYTLDAANGSLGPKKITGNLVVQNGATLTITGTLWVQGNVLISNNASVRLSSSYGRNSGVMVADGYVTISNNAQFAGSGQSGSHVLLLTTSECPTTGNCSSNNAIDLANNAGAVLLNAQKGTIFLNNGASAKEVVGYRVVLSNNANVTYDSGVTNQSFTSGPSGGWNVSGWRETQ